PELRPPTRSVVDAAPKVVVVVRIRVTAAAGPTTLRRHVRRVLGPARVLLRLTVRAAHPLLLAAVPSPISACRGGRVKRLPGLPSFPRSGDPGHGEVSATSRPGLRPVPVRCRRPRRGTAGPARRTPRARARSTRPSARRRRSPRPRPVAGRG